jgi:hypothetical protein
LPRLFDLVELPEGKAPCCLDDPVSLAVALDASQEFIRARVAESPDALAGLRVLDRNADELFNPRLVFFT